MRFLVHKRRGFSALEIVIVLVILSIFSSFAILSYSSYKKQARVKHAAQAVNSTLTTARTLAINQNADFQVQIDISGRHFWIDQLDSRGRIVKPKVTGSNWLPEGSLFTDVTMGGVTYNSGRVAIVFDADGSAEYATIHLIGENMDASQPSNYFSIRIYPSTGLTHIYKNQRK